MSFREKCIRKNVVFDGKILKVRCDEAELPDHKLCTREMVEHPGGACVLYIEHEKVLLVKQFRYPYGEELLEVPAGKLEAGEPPEQAALRELEEETGYIAENLSLLHVLYPSPGYTNEKIYIYLVERAQKSAAHPDKDEFLNCEFLSLEEVRRRIEANELHDAKTNVAIQTYLLKKRM